jgi:membrane protein
MRLSDLKYLIVQSIKEWGEDKVPRLSAALAYYTIFSIPPLLILFLAIAGLVFERGEVEARLISQVSGLVGQAGAVAVKQILENAREPGHTLIAGVITIVTLLFGASAVFGQLQEALNTIWEVQARPGRGILGTIKDRFFSFTMVVVVGFLLLVSLVISTALSAFNNLIVGYMDDLLIVASTLNLVVSFASITLLFALLFKVVPDVKIAWRDVWVGAAITALLFTIGKWAIGIYLGSSATASTYGAAASLIVILLWVYYSVQILFLGAEFTQVYANRFGSSVVADEDAIPLTKKARIQQGISHGTMVERQEATNGAPPVPPIGSLAMAGRFSLEQGSPGSSYPRAAFSLDTAQRVVRSFHRSMITILALPFALWRAIQLLLGEE